MRRGKRPGAVKCSEIKADGSVCGAWAVPGSDPPKCPFHSGTKAERSTRARRAASASAVARRGNVEPAARSGLDPGVTLADVLGVLVPAMTAELEYPPGAPDWSARLAAVAILVSSFPRQYRASPEAVRDLIEDLLPDRVLDQPGMRERLDADRAYAAARREWLQVPRVHPTRGLVYGFPRSTVPPWLDYAEVCRREIPPDEPLEEAEAAGKVERFEDGTVALRREGRLSLALQAMESARGS